LKQSYLNKGAILKSRSLLSLLVPAVLLAVWQVVGSQPGMQAMLPTPWRVVVAWNDWIFGKSTGMGLNPYLGTWWANVEYSATRVVVGFALSMVIAIPLGLLIGWSRRLSVLIDPMIQMFRPIPITAWLPFSIAAFGITNMGSISLIFLGGFFAIVVNATQGARDVDKNLVRAALMMGASPWVLLKRVVLPAALPNIFTGMRIGLGIAWTAVVAAEMVAVKSGLGYVLWDAYYVGRMDIVFADMASIGLMGFLSDRLIIWIERRVLKWRLLQNH
jgi:NitT/TauT family transport system permease protein